MHGTNEPCIIYNFFYKVTLYVTYDSMHLWYIAQMHSIISNMKCHLVKKLVSYSMASNKLAPSRCSYGYCIDYAQDPHNDYIALITAFIIGKIISSVPQQS